MQEIVDVLKDNLSIAVNRLKQQVGQCHSERSFEMGDMVYIQTTTLYADVTKEQR